MSDPLDPAGPTDGETVTISRSEFEALRASAMAVPKPREGQGPSRLDDPEGDDASNVPSRELANRDRRIAELESAVKAAIRDRELATALAGRPLTSGAANQLLKLWRDEFDVFEQDGSYRVARRDGRAVAQAVGEWLGSPEYAHFCLPTSRGGSGARDANRPSSAAQGVIPPKNLGEAVVMKWREESASRPESLLKPIGLRRNR
ncbi:MAG: hypothetical protein AB7I30_20565 [Isosphaeraceae bacterium]